MFCCIVAFRFNFIFSTMALQRDDVTFVSASKMNECKIWCRKPLKKVTTMVASEEVAKFIAIGALSETVALEIALWERTR